MLYTFYKVVVIVNRIREMRQAKGLKQSDLARLLAIAPTAVSKYELGQLDISSATICRLCEIFGCTADYLLGRSPLPSYALTPEEESLLLAFRASDQRAREMVLLALHPFWQEADEGKAI